MIHVGGSFKFIELRWSHDCFCIFLYVFVMVLRLASSRIFYNHSSARRILHCQGRGASADDAGTGSGEKRERLLPVDIHHDISNHNGPGVDEQNCR